MIVIATRPDDAAAMAIINALVTPTNPISAGKTPAGKTSRDFTATPDGKAWSGRITSHPYHQTVEVVILTDTTEVTPDYSVSSHHDLRRTHNIDTPRARAKASIPAKTVLVVDSNLVTRSKSRIADIANILAAHIVKATHQI